MPVDNVYYHVGLFELNGRQVEVLIPQFNVETSQMIDNPQPVFRGRGLLQIVAPNGLPIDRPFAFIIPATNIAEAFARLPEASKAGQTAAMEQFKQEMLKAQQALVKPNGAPLIPDKETPR